MKWNLYSKRLLKFVKKKYFHSFENRCVYDNNFINMENNEEILLLITLRNSNLNSMDWIKKTKRHRNGFRFNEVVELTINIDSNLSNINMLLSKVTSANYA